MSHAHCPGSEPGQVCTGVWGHGYGNMGMRVMGMGVRRHEHGNMGMETCIWVWKHGHVGMGHNKHML